MEPVHKEEVAVLFDDIDDENDTYEVEELENSVFRSSFYVPCKFYGRLVGKQGLTKMKIESETNTQIFIPSKSHNHSTWESLSMVSVKGGSRKDVVAARRRIELIIEALPNWQNNKVTHFCCVSVCTNDAIKKAFNNFKDSILNDNLPNINELLFTRAEKLHITFSASKLLDDEELSKAVQVLSECKEYLSKPIKVKMCGLEVSNNDPSSATHLYARLESPEFQVLADKILQKFIDARLNHANNQSTVTLLVALLNARMRMRKDPSSSRKFDARVILEKYGSYDFGTFTVSEVHLSKVQSTGANGFFLSIGCIKV